MMTRAQSPGACAAGLAAFCLAGALAWFAWQRAGFDSLVLMLEFRRLFEIPELAALPLLLVAQRLYADLQGGLPRPTRSNALLAGSMLLLAPGVVLLMFALAAAVLAPAFAPGHEQLLRAGLVPALILMGAGLLSARLSGQRPRFPAPRRFIRQLPLLLLCGLFYTGWTDPASAAALLLSWVGAGVVLYGRPRLAALSALPGQVVRAGAAGLPAVLWLGLMLSWAAATRDMGGVFFGTALPVWMLLPVLVIAGLTVGRALGSGLSAVALLAPPAILLALSAGLGLVTTGIVLTTSIVLGTARWSASTRAHDT